MNARANVKLPVETPDKKPDFWNLLRIAVDALKMWPPDYVQSVLGPVGTWFPPHDPYSEFTMLDPWRLRRALKYLVDISIPSASGAPPQLLGTLLPPAIEDLFFVRTQVLHRPDYYDDYTSFRNEHWFFINGILTNGDVAHLNAACISWLFHRPVTLIQNATDGALRDLWECALGKEWYQHTSNTESARIAFPAIYDALTDDDITKVVVLCHSQGTIIMSIVLNALEVLDRRKAPPAPPPAAALDLGLESARPDVPYVAQDESPIDLDDFEPLTDDQWCKLEVYCFATCANDMRYHCPDERVPWIEHFGNDRDLVARLGMLAPNAEEERIHIAGRRYVRPACGHLLNVDYLLPIADKQKPGRKRGGTCGAYPFKLDNPQPGEEDGQTPPVLYSYINGGPPRKG